MKTKITLLFFCLLWLKTSAQDLLQVPVQYPTIQSAIDAAQNGDTVFVWEGEYFENLRFKGKSIVLTSRFYITHTAGTISNTIINGSQPMHPDTASCILIVDGEDASTVVQGFTITGGKGTRWQDPAGAGTFREGGGILTEGTSPTIQFNFIRDNEVGPVAAGMVSNGGGGIRCGEGSPIIRNNWIYQNKGGGYGGGIVYNYCSGQIYNNLVSFNDGGTDFGGGGLWFTGNDQNTVVEVFNNTIVHNTSTGMGTYGGKGGGIFVFSIKLETRNNIIWGNEQTTGSAIAKFGSLVNATYSDIQGGYTGTGNFNLDPIFSDSIYYFSVKCTSPCVDAADPASNDNGVNGVAAFPSLGGVAGDLGVFGGPFAKQLPYGIQPSLRFSTVTTGALAGPPSDSRSINFIDVVGNGLDDIFVTNGPQAGAKNLFYLSNEVSPGAASSFTQVTDDPIVSHAKAFDGATFADCDNDGYLDAYVVTWYGQKNFLYRGGGDSWFVYDATAAPSNVETFSETASWGDYDSDGFVDLYVTNSGGTKKNLLFHNDGGTAFTPVTTGPHVTEAHTSRCVNWVDYDNDCDLDLYVSNESNEKDDLYRNLGNGSFEKVTAGTPGQTNHGSMSSSWGDVDNDGDLDLFVANADYFAPQYNQLFKNNGNGTFTEVTTGPLVTDISCSYGSNFGDYDNDGDLDLVVSNGYCTGEILNFLYQNDGLGNFTRDLEALADYTTPCSYGAAWGDVNNDGFLDLGIATCKNTSSSPLPVNLFYLNQTNCNNWLKIKLTGTVSNRSAIGARVWVTATIGGQLVTQVREISAQTGYCGQNSLTVHFGLGDAQSVDEVRVRFGCGEDTTLTGIAPNQLLEITEDMLPSTTHSIENEAFTVTVSPNPTSDTFQVFVKMQRPAASLRLRLTDTAGRLFLEKNIVTDEADSLEFSKKALGLAAGVYFLSVEAAGFYKNTALVLD
ncbi:MAG: CRTAC1 family protein [Bacteroidetes bacterium]|nr:CRTAC1 family protein [Bacteroidota bacterium]